MSKGKCVLAVGLLLCFTSILASADGRFHDSRQKIRHVLLISVDGLHALDVARYVADHPTSALAEMSSHGVTYTNARTPANSDSFPGLLLALVTGGSPITHGLFYDVSYDRSYFDPTNTTCSGTPGNNMIFDESIDLYNAANISLDVIDPTKLPRRLDSHGHCVPVFPHDAIRTNTIGLRRVSPPARFPAMQPLCPRLGSIARGSEEFRIRLRIRTLLSC